MSRNSVVLSLRVRVNCVFYDFVKHCSAKNSKSVLPDIFEGL